MFLRRKDRERYLLSIAIMAEINDWLEDKENPLDKDERKFLKMSSSFAKKSLKAFIERVDKEQRDRLMNMAKNYYASITPVRESGKQMALIETETIYDLATFPLFFMCQGKDRKCSHNAKNFKKCETFQILNDAQIPIARENGGCPYEL